ncbi:hypothetical protein D3C76_502660 [compost metagenome]
MFVELGLIRGKGIGHGIARQVEGVGRIPRTLAHITGPGTQAQAVSAEQAAKVIHRRQRAAVPGHVLQAVAFKVRVFGHLGIGKGIAADQAPAFAELPGQVQLDTA